MTQAGQGDSPEVSGTRFRGPAASRIPWVILLIAIALILGAVYFMFLAPR